MLTQFRWFVRLQTSVVCFSRQRHISDDSVPSRQMAGRSFSWFTSKQPTVCRHLTAVKKRLVVNTFTSRCRPLTSLFWSHSRVYVYTNCWCLYNVYVLITKWSYNIYITHTRREKWKVYEKNSDTTSRWINAYKSALKMYGHCFKSWIIFTVMAFPRHHWG